MAILISRAEQSYPPGTYSITRTVPNGAVVNKIKLSLSDAGDWPVGRVANVRLVGPAGSVGGASFDGGVVLGRDGLPLTLRTCEFSQSNNQGIVPFPVGDYTLSFDVLQTVTSTVLVERF